MAKAWKVKGLAPHRSRWNCARRVITTRYREMTSFQSGAAAGADIEFVHDMRVSSRRLLPEAQPLSQPATWDGDNHQHDGSCPGSGRPDRPVLAGYRDALRRGTTGRWEPGRQVGSAARTGVCPHARDVPATGREEAAQTALTRARGIAMAKASDRMRPTVGTLASYCPRGWRRRTPGSHTSRVPSA
jgi:hypothetical protein